ncbi:peptidase inhibitor 16-like [Argopecten irradians]|uniref:peptidase inhibitor 16-like n=1 Tax=Argopecten irradians TaxID=31199 RepID=UPI00371620E8
MQISLFLVCVLLAAASSAPDGIVLRELEKELEESFQLGGELLVDRKSTDKNGLTEAEKDDILGYHNDVRSNVEPSASNMLKMKWSDELATIAQDYADKCIWGHNGERSSGSSFWYVGENIFLSSYYNGKYTVDRWASEESDYTYSSNSCSGVCGHYTQVAWASSEYLGCGAKKCSSLEGLSWSNAVIVVCNYGNGGNFRGYRPYNEGTSCSQCPSGTTCENGLCA